MAMTPTPAGWSIPGAGVSIDATRATVWSPALPRSAWLFPDPELAHRIAAARELVDARVTAGGLWPTQTPPWDPWLDTAHRLLGRLQNALAAKDADGAVIEARRLIGLGVGLTPSGDDYLVGLLAGMEARGHPLRNALAAGVSADAPRRTTAVAARALQLAARGAYAERLRDVIVTLGGPDPWRRALIDAADRALAYGSTSGSDTLAGLFTALDLTSAGSPRVAMTAA
jgi:hypothetical protein